MLLLALTLFLVFPPLMAGVTTVAAVSVSLRRMVRIQRMAEDGEGEYRGE